MFKFLHAADIHLDSPMTGLEQYEGAPAELMRGATRRAFENLVETAIEREADFVVISGDLYDGDWRDFNTGLFFVKNMARLREAGIRVFVVSGNHDAHNTMTKSLRLPDNVTWFPSSAPETAVLDDLPVAIHGQSFPNRAVTENLAAGYPSPVKGRFNIGVLHTSATGRPGHETYAPCTAEALAAHGYDYWALGHVHARETLSKQPFIGFPGNTQGRNIREAGPKGCLFAEVDDGALDTQFIPLDAARWAVVSIDAADCETEAAVLSAVSGAVSDEAARAEGRVTAVRVQITGPTPLHEDLAGNQPAFVNEVRAAVIDAAHESVWVEKVQLDTRPPTESMFFEPDTPLGELAAVFAEFEENGDALESIAAEFEPLRQGRTREFAKAAGLDDAETLRRLCGQAFALLRERLRASAPVSTEIGGGEGAS